MREKEPQVINPLKDKTDYGWHFEQNVYDADGIIRSLKSSEGSGNIPKVIEKQSDSAQIKPVIDIYNQRMLKDDICGTITAHGNASPTTCGTFGIVEREDTMGKDKFIMDGNFNQRGVVHTENGICRTLIGQGHAGNEPKVLTKHAEKGGDNLSRVGQISNDGSQCGSVYSDNDSMATLTAGTHGYANPHICTQYRIRKLTPRECWRLMDFSDEDFDKAEEVNSNTQLYKQAGNSIVVNVLTAIMGQMFLGKEGVYREHADQNFFNQDV